MQSALAKAEEDQKAELSRQETEKKKQKTEKVGPPSFKNAADLIKSLTKPKQEIEPVAT